jgi:hypothetical protein
MPLRPRQKNKAVNYYYDSLMKDGWTEEQVTQDLEQMPEADRTRAFSNAWKASYKESAITPANPDAGKVGAAIAGFGESFGFKLPRVAAGVIGAVKSLGWEKPINAEDFDPIEGAKKGWQAHEDRLTFHELTNPETYNLFNIAGYISPGGMASTVFKGGLKMMQAAGAGAKAAMAGASGLTGLAQTTIERPIEGEASLQQGAIDVGISLAAPAVATKVGNVVVSGGKSVRAGFLSGSASVAKAYSKLIGKTTDLTDELLENAPEVAKVLQEGVPALQTKITAAGDDLMANVKGYLTHLKSSLDLPETQLGKTAKELQGFYTSALDDIGKEIAEGAASSKGLVKAKIKESFDTVKGLAVLGQQAVKAQYGAKLRPLETLGESLQLDISDAVNAFADPLIDAGLLINRGGTPANLPTQQTLRKAFHHIFEMKKTPLTFKQLNTLKMQIGDVTDWNAQDPLNVALKNLYTGFRTKLTEGARGLPTDINVDKLFGEYQGALQLSSKFKSAFYAKAADGASEILPSAPKLKELINLGKGFTELTPVDHETRNHMARMIRMSVRDTKLSKMVDPYQVSNTLKRLVSNQFFDEKVFQRNFESVLGKVKSRRTVFEIADNWALPTDAKSAITSGGATFRNFMDNLPPTLQGSKASLQQLHDKYHKGLRQAGYKANEVFEMIKQKSAMAPEQVEDLYELAALSPEFAKLTSMENLLKLAKSSETTLKVLPSLTRSVGMGAPLAWFAGPTAAFTVGFLDRLHSLASQPAALRLMAEKYKWVPSDRAAAWAQEIAFIATKVLPAMRDEASDSVTTTTSTLHNMTK